MGVGERGWAGQPPVARERCRWEGSVPSACGHWHRDCGVWEEACELGAEQKSEVQTFVLAWPVLTP